MSSIWRKIWRVLVATVSPTLSSSSPPATSLAYTLLLSCFSVAHLSYLLQFDGLFSDAGLEPISAISGSASRLDALPTIASSLGLRVDDAARLLCRLGFLAALVGAMSPARNAVIRFATLLSAVLCYAPLLVRGGTFLNFQWDILLLEVGVAALLTCGLPAPPLPSLAVLRFCAAKLLFMSGAVKLQAACPTWEKLTALDVHFASQPLPTPLAWVAHNFPPLFLSVGVAASIWVELLGALLLITPFTSVRLFAARANALLQMLIMLTGNYNFFNGLTLALLLFACADVPSRTPYSRAVRIVFAVALCVFSVVSVASLVDVSLRPAMLTVPSTASAVEAAAHYGVPPEPASAVKAVTQIGGGVGGLPIAATENVTLAVPWFLRVDMAVAPAWRASGELGVRLDALIRGMSLMGGAVFIAASLQYTYEEIVLVVSDLSGGGMIAAMGNGVGAGTALKLGVAFLSAPLRAVRGGLRAARLVFVIAAGGALLLASITALATLRVDELIRPALNLPARSLLTLDGVGDFYSAASRGLVPPHATQAYVVLADLRASSGYGLFRRMTGVGPDGVVDAWGLPVTSTLRPEIILEGRWTAEQLNQPTVVAVGDADADGWRELPLPYAPRDRTRAPPWIAPHSPRLDWQFWFEALSPAPSLWMLHLVQKILNASPEVLALMIPADAGRGGLPWPVTQEGVWLVAPSEVRARRAALDFSRPFVDAQWSRRHLPISKFFADPLDPAAADPEVLSNATARAASGLNVFNVHAGLLGHPAFASVLQAISPTNQYSRAAASLWWQREDAAEADWFAPTGRGDARVAEALSRAGWLKTGSRARARNCTAAKRKAAARAAKYGAQSLSVTDAARNLTLAAAAAHAPNFQLAVAELARSLFSASRTTVMPMVSNIACAALEVTTQESGTSKTAMQSLPPVAHLSGGSAHLSAWWLPVTTLFFFATASTLHYILVDAGMSA